MEQDSAELNNELGENELVVESLVGEIVIDGDLLKIPLDTEEFKKVISKIHTTVKCTVEFEGKMYRVDRQAYLDFLGSPTDGTSTVDDKQDRGLSSITR